MKRAGTLKKILFLYLMLAILLAAGCAQQEEEKKTLEFTVVEEKRLPEELLKIVEEKKKEPFKLTYADGGYLYLCVGYGKQQTGGYSISVNELSVTENAICLDTDLIGPKQAEEKSNMPSYPYLVVKTPFMDKTVVFD